MTLYIDNKIDPLAIIENGRELSSPISHFVCVSISNIAKTRKVKDWVWKNLEGRFNMTEDCICFEIPEEASMFALIRDQFKQ